MTKLFKYNYVPNNLISCELSSKKGVTCFRHPGLSVTILANKKYMKKILATKVIQRTSKCTPALASRGIFSVFHTWAKPLCLLQSPSGTFLKKPVTNLVRRIFTKIECGCLECDSFMCHHMVNVVYTSSCGTCMCAGLIKMRSWLGTQFMTFFGSQRVF